VKNLTDVSNDTAEIDEFWTMLESFLHAFDGKESKNLENNLVRELFEKFTCWYPDDTIFPALITDICKYGKLDLDGRKIHLRRTKKCRPYMNVPNYHLGEMLHDMRHVLECKLLYLSLEHYKFVQQRAKENIDTWCIVARRLGVCKDVRRIISNQVWSSRDTWELTAPIVVKHKQWTMFVYVFSFLLSIMYFWWYFPDSWTNWFVLSCIMACGFVMQFMMNEM
jgi:hypothetical protein